ncbi:MAG TPA: GMC family oxidoreductase N-terminal domain-containing protein, partial [Burkholderiaceae bacterium]
MNFDYIVVGGGSGGSVLAARLSEDADVSVALIEAGPADKNVLIHCPAGLAALARTRTANWNFSTVPQKGLNGRVGWSPRGKVLGGSSSVNAMVYTRGHRADYDHWAEQGNPGWSYDEILPYFKRAEHNERLRDDYHGTGGPLNVMDLRSPNVTTQPFVDAGR